MSEVVRVLSAAAVAVLHFAGALLLGPTQAFLCIALGDCAEDFRRPRPAAGILDWPVVALPGQVRDAFLGSAYPMYALVNALAVALAAWLLLSLVAWLRRPR